MAKGDYVLASLSGLSIGVGVETVRQHYETVDTIVTRALSLATQDIGRLPPGTEDRIYGVAQEMVRADDLHIGVGYLCAGIIGGAIAYLSHVSEE